MSRILKFIFSLLSLLLISANSLLAQCAMCRTVVENNVSAGETEMASSLNFGILYLLGAPYILVALVGILWYLKSKKNAQKIKFKSYKGA